MLLTARRLPVYPSGLQPQHYCNLVTTVLPRAPRAIRPHLEREVLPLGGHEAQLLEERGLAGERQHLGEAVRPRLGEQRLEQRAPDARALPIGSHGEARDLGQRHRVHLERAAPHDRAALEERLRNDVLLDVPAQVVIAARQQIAGRDVRRHEGLELRHVGEHRRSHHHTGEEGEGRGTRRCTERTSPLSLLPEDRHRAHARTSSRIPTPRSSSSRVTTSGGTRRITFAPAVATSRWRSRAAATKGAAGSVSSIPHIRPRPRTSATRLRRAATPARDAPSGPPPNVVAWSPGFKAAAMPSVRSTAPIGSPPASGFARVSMSGTTSACS